MLGIVNAVSIAAWRQIVQIRSAHSHTEKAKSSIISGVIP